MKPQKLVPAPYGYVDEDKVFEVDNTMRVCIRHNKHLVVINKFTGEIIKDFGITEPRPSNPVKLDKNGNVMSPEEYPGYTVRYDINNISSFKTTWTVPDIPEVTEPYGLFYIWNGLSYGVFQPVLSWGYHGPKYEISNWATVDGVHYFYSSYEDVNPGDELTGIVTFMGIVDDLWAYNTSFEGYPELDLEIMSDKEAATLVECFESYTQDMRQVPSSLFCAMREINVTLTEGAILPDELNWYVTGEGLPTPSGKNTVIVDKSPTNGEIDFYFH